MDSKSLAGVVLLLFCCFAIGHSETTKAPMTIKPDQIGSSIIVMGDLNQPVGKELTIHGFRRSVVKDYDRFEVDEVDGRRINPPIAVGILHIDKWPEGTEATMRGYEHGTLRYTDQRETGLANHSPFTPKQVLYLLFEPVAMIKGPPRVPKQTARDPKSEKVNTAP